MKYKYFLFDWDGCLADTTQIWLDAYFLALESRGVKITVEILREKAWGNRELGPKNLGIQDNVECWDEVVTTASKLLGKVTLHGGAKSMLEWAKNGGCKIALVTSSDKDVILSALKHNKIERFFDVVLAREDVQKIKPDPEIVEKALQVLKANKNETIIIGDTESDILAGKAAVITTGLITHPKNNKLIDVEKLKNYKPDYVFKNFREAINLFNGEN